MIDLKVTFNDGDYFYTRFNGTREEAESYYLSRNFNTGSSGDRIRQCVSLEFLGGDDDKEKA